MGLFGMGGSKKDTELETGEWGSDMVGMMKMLGGMPHMMRKPMMKGRLNQLLSLTEARRQESIRDMIGAFHSPKVKGSVRDSLVATRLEIIGEMTEDKRQTIMQSRTVALKVAPELDEADRLVQDKVLTKLPQNARNAFTATWTRLQEDSGNR